MLPRIVVLAVLLLGAALVHALTQTPKTSEAKEPSNAEKIIGTWKMVKSGGVELPKEFRITIEFTREGKGKMIVDGKVVDEGSYTIDGDKIIVTKPNNPKEEPKISKIKLLTADTLIILDAKGEGKDGKNLEAELKKVK